MIRTVALLILMTGCERAAAPSRAEGVELGASDWSPSPADRARMGVTVHDAARAQPGYTLITLPGTCNAQLLTLAGEIVHSWTLERCVSWDHTTLLENGDILVPGVAKTVLIQQPPFDQRRYLLRMAWDGKVLWQQKLTAHHQAISGPNSTVLTLTLRDRRIPEIDAHHSVRDNLIASLSALDMQELSLYDALTAGGVTPLPVPRGAHGSHQMDLFHASSIDLMHRPELAARNPLYRVGNLLVSVTRQDSLAIVDPHAARAVWSWGRGVLSNPHDATVLDDGHILVLDNGRTRGWSRVIELDPVTEQVVWQWGRAEPRDFFTAERGSAQRLGNGNTLISESDEGHVFEITRDGDIVWEYWVPLLNHRGHRAAIVRARRYDSAFIDAWLHP